MEREVFAFCVITFKPTNIKTPLAPQNDRLNLGLVRDIHVFGKKKTDCKWSENCYLSVANFGDLSLFSSFHRNDVRWNTSTRYSRLKS